MCPVTKELNFVFKFKYHICLRVQAIPLHFVWPLATNPVRDGPQPRASGLGRSARGSQTPNPCVVHTGHMLRLQEETRPLRVKQHWHGKFQNRKCTHVPCGETPHSWVLLEHKDDSVHG